LVALAWGDVDEADRLEMPPRTPRSHAATWFILGFSRKVRNRRLHGPEWSCTVLPTPLRQSQRRSRAEVQAVRRRFLWPVDEGATTAALLVLEPRRRAEVGPGRCRTSMEPVVPHREADALAICRGCAARRRRAAGASRRHPAGVSHTRRERSPRRAGHGRPPRRRRRSAPPERRRCGRGSGGRV